MAEVAWAGHGQVDGLTIPGHASQQQGGDAASGWASGPRGTADHEGPRALTAAQHTGSDQMLEAGHHRAPGDTDSGGEGPLGGDTSALAQHPAIDGIEQCGGELLVARS